MPDQDGLVKCGEKGRHLPIPNGWKLLGPREIVDESDKVANVRQVEWTRVESDEVGLPAEAVGDFVITLIDKTNGTPRRG